jgi:hypothetical protein
MRELRARLVFVSCLGSLFCLLVFGSLGLFLVPLPLFVLVLFVFAFAIIRLVSDERTLCICRA